MTAQDTPNSFSEWQREIRYTYWHEPSNMILEVTGLDSQWRWQIVEYYDKSADGCDLWKVVYASSDNLMTSNDAPLTTPEAAQAAALAWLDEDGE